MGLRDHGKVELQVQPTTRRPTRAATPTTSPPGHTPVLFEGTEIVEFSPTEELDRTFEVVTRNMHAAAQA